MTTYSTNRTIVRIKTGQDAVLTSPHINPYKHVRHLGQGGYATVDEVRDKTTSRVYARKTYKTRYNKDRDAVEAQFREEVRIMRRLPHHHIVSVHATYKLQQSGLPRVLAMILTPVAANGTLQNLLDAVSKPGHTASSAQRAILQSCFGCMGSALKHIHQRAVRHKDVKPSNILIDRGRLLLSDFGNAFDGSERGATTSGPAVSFTRAYSAPDVLAHRKRNAKSDMFSLGCVYLDVLSALFPDQITERPKTAGYGEAAPAFQKQLLRAKDIPRSVWVATYRLIDGDSTKRLTSEGLCNWFRDFGNGPEGGEWKKCCHDCLAEGTSGMTGDSSMFQVVDGDADDSACQQAIAGTSTDAHGLSESPQEDTRRPGPRDSTSDDSFVLVNKADALPSPEVSLWEVYICVEVHIDCRQTDVKMLGFVRAVYATTRSSQRGHICCSVAILSSRNATAK
ncbi:hypothetical protein LTR85_008479 [Meristemomyces frigidus]|nr:hypothetical protein LTR85_008479 [Meristemomyces frigidus]